MSDRISDLRNDIADIDAARAVFDELAMLIIKLTALDAALEKRMAKLKLDHADANAGLISGIREQERRLARFIEQNKALFKDPRKIKTNLGSFGLQAVSELVIEDPDLLEKYLVRTELKDCFKVLFSPIKPAIKKRVEAGSKIPGVRVVDGDTAVIKVDKAILDSAKTGTPLAIAAAEL